MAQELTVINCPKCEKGAVEVPRGVLSYFDPHFAHKCGFKGKLYWLNPNPPKPKTRKKTPKNVSSKRVSK